MTTQQRRTEMTTKKKSSIRLIGLDQSGKLRASVIRESRGNAPMRFKGIEISQGAFFEGVWLSREKARTLADFIFEWTDLRADNQKVTGKKP